MVMARRLILVPLRPDGQVLWRSETPCLASAKTLRQAQQKRKQKYVRMKILIFTHYFQSVKGPAR
jgi:hypothetical protein